EFGVEEATGEIPTGDVPRDFVHYDVTLLKTSNRKLVLGSVVAPRKQAAQGLSRAREVAEALGALTEKPVRLPEPMLVSADGRRRRKRRKGGESQSSGARSNR